MFKIQEKNKPETAIWLKDDAIMIANDGTGVLHFDSTSPSAAKIKIILENEKPYLADMTFNQPIFINDLPIPPGSKRALKHADLIQIGSSLFEIFDPLSVVDKLNQSSPGAVPSRDGGLWHLKATGNWLDGQVFPLKGKTIIGRDQSCTITIPGSHLSRRHVEFLVVGSKLMMKDLDSSNGCYVNGKRCKEAIINDGDDLKLDVLTFKVIGPNEKKSKISDTVTNKAVNPDKSAPADVTDKNWVTKPTSAGNAAHDPHDHILADHIRQKKIMYGGFGVSVLVALVVLFALFYDH